MIHCGNGDGIDRCLKHLPDTLDLNGLIGGVQDDEPWAESFLHKAVKTGYFDVVSHLVSDERICIDCQDECGATPLLLAALSDDPDMTRLLLRNEANPLLQNFVGESPLSVSIDGVAARSMYDIEKNQWSIVAAEYATEQRYDILDQLISALDAMSEVGAVDGVDGVDVAYLDQLIFRLISCDRVQRDNLKKMFQVRERLEPDNTLYAKSAKLIEPMFAIGHKENLDIALQEFQTLFGTSSQRRELIEAYGRSDLNAVFNIT